MMTNAITGMLEKRAATHHETQAFIETPYRNDALLHDILTTCHPHTLLCVAANLTQPDAFIRTASIGEWRQRPAPSLKKKPCVFLLLNFADSKKCSTFANR
jgi:16S rRNA (cytidine1402-2'-O)-methyltransferase